jgi:hypothetical protein
MEKKLGRQNVKKEIICLLVVGLLCSARGNWVWNQDNSLIESPEETDTHDSGYGWDLYSSTIVFKNVTMDSSGFSANATVAANSQFVFYGDTSRGQYAFSSLWVRVWWDWTGAPGTAPSVPGHMSVNLSLENDDGGHGRTWVDATCTSFAYGYADAYISANSDSSGLSADGGVQNTGACGSSHGSGWAQGPGQNASGGLGEWFTDDTLTITLDEDCEIGAGSSQANAQMLVEASGYCQGSMQDSGFPSSGDAAYSPPAFCNGWTADIAAGSTSIIFNF